MTFETFDDYIKHQIKQGFWREEDLAPIKCEYCESTDLKDTIHSYTDCHMVEEYDRECNKCGELVGVWSYGNWQL